MRSEDTIERLSASPRARFQWPRKRGGYEIAEGWGAPSRSGADVGRYVTFIAETVAAGGQEPEWYDPATEQAALFQEGANLELSAEALLRFANDWGLPGEPNRYVRGQRDDPKLSSEEIDRRAEPGWSVDTALGSYPLAQLGPVVRAWEILKSASAAEVRDLFELRTRVLGLPTAGFRAKLSGQ